MIDIAIEVLVTVCLAAAPVKCKDVQLQFFSDHAITPQECMRQGQVEISKWMESHPGWQVSRWKCGEAKKRIDV